MDLHHPRHTQWYLATPYTRYPHGLEEAYRLALRQAGLLIKAGVPVFSPIAHTHPIAMECGFDPKDVDFWLKVDAPMIGISHGIIIVEAESWETSRGIAHEHDEFTAAGKPVLRMQPNTLTDPLVEALKNLRRPQLPGVIQSGERPPR
jgi:hypothetical protein